ncbi:MAG: competence/damage-inducible protein A [Acidobacteriota bacterium]
MAVGSELLTPYRIDSNSLYLTRRLNEFGIVVRAKSVVGDNRADLATHLRLMLARAPLVITTGGLGPTADDLTREVVAEVLGRPLEEDPQILDGIRARFDRRGVPMPSINRKQAQVPGGAIVLPNAHGTAPGLYFEDGGRVVVLLPGPPRELQPMFEAHVAARLAARMRGRTVHRRVLKMTGRSESQVEEVAEPIYSRLQNGPLPIDTTILASPGQIELHLSAGGRDAVAIDGALAAAVASLESALNPFVFSTDGRSLEEVVGDLLRVRKWMLAAAESCTGGLLLGRLTDVPGSSAWVTGGVVAYADDVKVRELGVAADVIAAYGVVSEPTAIAMAEGVRARLGTDVGVSITGIAGPGGGSPEKPVGTVAVAVAVAGLPSTLARTFHFPGDRETVRRHSTSAALEMVRRALVSESR